MSRKGKVSRTERTVSFGQKRQCHLDKKDTVIWTERTDHLDRKDCVIWTERTVSVGQEEQCHLHRKNSLEGCDPGLGLPFHMSLDL